MSANYWNKQALENCRFGFKGVGSGRCWRSIFHVSRLNAALWYGRARQRARSRSAPRALPASSAIRGVRTARADNALRRGDRTTPCYMGSSLPWSAVKLVPRLPRWYDGSPGGKVRHALKGEGN